MRLNMVKCINNMKKTGDYLKNKKGITVMEIVIVIAISSIIMGVAMAMMSRSNTQFKRSTNMINIQRLMDNIIERIRSDVRSLKRIVPSDDNGSGNDTITSGDPNKISFVVVKFIDAESYDDIDKEHNYSKITYEFDPKQKTLFRYEIKDCDMYGVGGETVPEESNFHGMNQVLSMNFDPVFNHEYEDGVRTKRDSNKGDDFKCLNVAMQLVANEYSSKDSDASTLSIACQFYSTCVESKLRFDDNK